MSRNHEESSGPRPAGAPPRLGANARTHLGIAAEARRLDPFPIAFGRVFGELRRLWEGFRGDGLLAAAAWRGSVLADYLHLPIDADPEFFILGRHGQCDLTLGHDPGVSLRHALVGAHRTGQELRVRLLDLRSEGGFKTEDDRPCESLSADGALFVQIGGYHLFLLPTGSLSPLPWGRTGDETWASFPERVYHDCRLPTRAPAEIRRRVAPSRRPGTINTQILEPPGVLRRGRPAAGARGTQIGELELVADGGAERHPVHEADLEQGLLVGRYDRCELGAGDATLSRVHLLLVRDDDAIWAVDTASTNGTTLAGVPIRKARLADGGELVLGKTVTLRWHRSV